ncbi:MAG: right-handed parallel beta-helix repeat-containing protein [Verrucomicrobiales bacterium]|nr:right-handed parallel beta-helix repeat-containing protein [Verrucomicrobiales bacterium]
MKKFFTICLCLGIAAGLSFNGSRLVAADNPVLPPKQLKVVNSDVPGILVQPTNQYADAGRSATFTVTATGDAPLSYSWTFNGSPVGTDSPTYVRSNCQVSDNGGRIRVTVRNARGSVQSTIAILTVRWTGTNYYVSPSGSAGNNGLSPSSPWSLSHAMAQVGVSNTINLLPGTYPTIYIYKRGCTVRSTVKWGAKVVGSPGSHAIYSADGIHNVMVEGVHVQSSYIDGIKINGTNSTIRGCWIQNAGRGHPSAVQNSNGSYTGQGISAYNLHGTVIEQNLIENCGMNTRKDHGMYVSGTNLVIRGNVVRNNLSWGIQVYDSYGDCRNVVVNNNLVYGNGVGALTIWSKYNHTNYILNNTLIASEYCVIAENCRLVVANNIIMAGPSWYPCLAGPSGTIIYSSNNVFNKPSSAGDPRTASDLVTSNPGFLNTARGLYWLTSSSPARGRARKVTAFNYPNFFADADLGSASRDAGAFEYDPSYAGDTRVLAPSPAVPDYWARVLN